MANASNVRAAGRLAGLAYLVIIIFSTAGYATLTGLLAGDPHGVLARLAMNQPLFMSALIASVIGFAAWVVLGALLYRLMGSAGRISGLLMLIFVVAGAVTSLIALSALAPLVGANITDLDADTATTMVRSYQRQLLLTQVFSGLWMFPFGWLVLRSRIAPQLLGFCLMVGGLGYVLLFATAFAPNLDHMMAYRIVSIALGVPAMIGELGTCLWLLFKGAREPGVDRPATGAMAAA